MFSQNGAGHLVEEAYFKEAGKPTLSKEGYAECSTTYNDYGNEAKRAYFGEAGKPVLAKSGVASIVFGYDAAGLRLSMNAATLPNKLTSMKPESRRGRIKDMPR
jgi:hypothetical protein